MADKLQNNSSSENTLSEVHDGDNLSDSLNLINNHPDLICKWLPDGTLTFANKAYCRYFNKSLEELIGKTCLDTIHPSDQEKLAKHISKFNRDHTEGTIELQIINPEGRIRWHQWRDKYIHDIEQPQGEFFSTGRDITELKQAEIELDHKMGFQQLVTALSIDFINSSLDNIDDHINQALARIGQFVNADRSYIFLFDDQNQTLSNTHEWCQDGIDSYIENLQSLPIEPLAWWVSKIKNAETILIPEVADMPGEASILQEIFTRQRIQSMIGVPVISAGAVLGFIGFDSVNQPKSWTEDEAAILQLVGAMIGNALTHKRNQEALTKHNEYMEKLNRITIASLNSRNIGDMLSIIAQNILDLIDADNCSINLWDDERKTITSSAYNVNFAVSGEESTFKPDEPSMTEVVLEEESPIWIEDVRESPLTNQRLFELFNTRSLLGVPMIASGQKLGAVLFGFKEFHQSSDQEIALAQQAVSQVSHALQKQRLLEKANTAAREAETLHKASTIVASTLDVNLAIESILDQLELVVPFDSASVQILTDNYLEIKAGKGWPEDYNPVGKKFPIPGDNPNTKVILSGKPYIINNAAERYEGFTDQYHAFIRSWLGVPLTVHDSVIGMLTLDNFKPDFYDDPHLIKLVTAFADQVAISLENANLYDRERRRVQELNALRATTAELTKELALENLIHSILERATSLLNASGGELGLMDESDSTMRILVSHKMGKKQEGLIIKPGEGLMGYVAETRQIAMIEDYAHWNGRMRTYNKSNIHAAIAAPLMIGNRLLGVIGIMNSDHRRKFTQSEKSLLNLFAQQAAIAVQNAQLYEEIKRQARMDLTTGIYNRRGLFELGDREIDRAERYERPLAALFIDIDEFKIVNDQYGHPVGDIILEELAERLKHNLRSIDILGRYGGEEFVILLPETSVEMACDVAERLRQIVEKKPFTPNKLSLPITVSIGVATTTGERCSLETLIEHADHAMYRSKDAGRNQVHLCEHSL